MPAVTCPWCGEPGNLPDQMLGKKVRCQKCHAGFVAGEPPASQISSALKPVDGSIEIEGLDPSTWVASSEVLTEPRVERPSLSQSPVEPAPSTAPPQTSRAPNREYKVLTTKDRWFEGKFEITRLEECLNHYALQGWSVRGMATPHVTGFSGGPREEIVILMER